MQRFPAIGFDYPLPAPGVALRRGHWTTDGLRAVLVPNSGRTVRVYDPVRDLFTPIGDSTHGAQIPTPTGLIGFTTVNDVVQIAPNSSHILSTSQVTLLLVRRKMDSTARAACHIGVDDDPGTLVTRCNAYVPFSDGTVKWTFGGSTDGSTKVTISGLTFTPELPEIWAFVAGPHGMAVYLNGSLLGSHATAASRTQATEQFTLNQGGTSAITGDLTEVSFAAVLDAEWNEDQVRAWTANQGVMFAPRAKVLRFFPSPIPDGLKIAGTSKPIRNWHITETLNGRNVFTFDVDSMDGTYRPAARAITDFVWNATRMFKGHIQDLDEGGLGGYPVVPITTHVGAVDFSALPDRRQVAITIPAGYTLKQAVNHVKVKLEGYGTTVHPDQVDGPTFAEDFVVEFGPLTDVLNKLSVATGFAWHIDYSNRLRMFEPGSEDAPFNIAEDDGKVIGDIRVQPSLNDYANWVLVRYTIPAVAAYAFFALAGIPSEDETVTIGGQTYTWKAAPAGGNEVQIGGSADASIDNLIGAVFPAHAEVVAFKQSTAVMKITAKEPGSAGNGIQVSTTCVDGSWGADGFANTSHLVWGADDELTGEAIAEDVPAQDGGANLFEKIFTEAKVTDAATAQLLADGYLARSLVTPREIRYRTRIAGLHPGQLQVIEESRRNISGDCLITAVDISPEGLLINYDVTAVEGLVIPEDHRDTYRRWGKLAS